MNHGMNSGLFIRSAATIFFVAGAFGAGAEDLPADELIATIDALPVTGPRDQRTPDASIGETATFPAPGVAPIEVADAILRCN